MPAPSAFISYSREDSEFALRLAQDLKAAGAPIWLDQMDINPGHPWDNAIEDALNDAPLMLLILSPASARSDNVRNEISYALEAGKIIIPVLYRDCVVPLRLQRTQRIDFRADYARGLAALLQHLKVPQPDPAVLERAAEGDAQRQAAWQAREAEAKRLRDALESQKEPEPAAPSPPAEPEQLTLQQRARQREQELRDQAHVREQSLRKAALYGDYQAQPAARAGLPARNGSASLLPRALIVIGAIALVAIVLYFLIRRPADSPHPVVITQSAPITNPPANPSSAQSGPAARTQKPAPAKRPPTSTANPFNLSAPGESAYGPMPPAKSGPMTAADNLISGKPGSNSIAGTTWTYTDLSMGSTPHMRLEFQAGGNLRAIWLASSTTYDHCSWKQTGDTIYFQFDNQYQQFHGRISGSTMTGTATNKPGISWNWMAARQ